MIYNEFGVKRYVNSFIAGIFILCVYYYITTNTNRYAEKYSNKMWEKYGSVHSMCQKYIFCVSW